VRAESGAASVEWIGLVLLVSMALGSLGAAAPLVDGRSFGALISHALVCAVEGDCDATDASLVAAYGERDAALVRRHAPSLVYEPGERQLPVDYRHCREAACAAAPDDPDLDVHRTTEAAHPATAFTHLARRDGETFVQYWLYYPDSNTAALGSDELWPHVGPLVHLGARLLTGSSGYPGYHRDDWESYQVRVASDGGATVRASSHGGYQWCKQSECTNRWGPSTGWTRVSHGSHAGHIPLEADVEGVRLATWWSFAPLELRHSFSPQYPGAGLQERTTTAAGLRLVPIERLDQGAYAPLDPDVTPPWEKEVYGEPLSDSTG
jgi:hypothetical protein